MSLDPSNSYSSLLGLTYQFQPIVAADGRRLLAYETLVRRSSPDGTIAGPGSILPELLHPQKIEVFTRYTLEFAVARLAADPYLAALSVNLSPRQIELAVTDAVLARSPLSVRRRLMIELTEDPIIDHPALPSVLHAIRSLGVRIFLDDVAPSSQHRCSTLLRAVNGLKLDRALLPALAADKVPPSVGGLLDMALDNGLELVAEGVEDVELLPRLAARGVSYFQGFALGEPWSDPRIARRRIIAPRSPAPMPEPELMSTLAPAASGKCN